MLLDSATVLLHSGAFRYTCTTYMYVYVDVHVYVYVSVSVYVYYNRKIIFMSRGEYLAFWKFHYALATQQWHQKVTQKNKQLTFNAFLFFVF